MDIFLDTEFVDARRLLEVALIDEAGEVLLNTRCQPASLEFDLQWRITKKIHGISPDDVKESPLQPVVIERVLRLCAGNRVIAYGAGSDSRVIPGLQRVADVHCAAKRYKGLTGAKQMIALHDAIRQIGVPWLFGRMHSAQADALACREIWRWCCLQRCDKVFQELGFGPVLEPIDKPTSLADRARALAAKFGPSAPKGEPIEQARTPGLERRGTSWTDLEKTAAKDAWFGGSNLEKIASSLHRTSTAVAMMLVKVGVAGHIDDILEEDAKRLEDAHAHA